MYSTLSTRKRRTLHLVADSWEKEGGQCNYIKFFDNILIHLPSLGHFERRISLGYDADLSQVRAEFDGELLSVVVPRKPPQISWFSHA